MSGLDIPVTIDAGSVTEWSDEVDVVVIGFGIGGGCAAVTAAAAGARVLVLERAAVAGGTPNAVTPFNMAGSPYHQVG